MMLPHGSEGLRMRRMTVLCTFRRPFMGRSVRHQLMRNELLDLTTIVPATAYHRRSYAERYSRSNVKQQIVDMAMNASGIRDIARVLHISPTTVLKELKKRNLSSNR